MPKSDKKESYPIDTIRHSTAHALAAAVSELFPGTKFGVGPVIENGFFYDMDLPAPITAQNLLKIEKRMKEIIRRREKFIRKEMSIAEAISYFDNLGQTYKVELLRDLMSRGTTSMKPEELRDVGDGKPTSVSVYETGKFVDLCRGPHVDETGDLGAFKLTKIAGAYWRGSEKNKMLTRIYGLAFKTEEELAAHLKMMEEAEKRDHRKLGAELDLFVFSDLVGPGLPLFTPHGQLVRSLLDDFVWQMRRAKGYDRVEIPHITKKDLYEKSGHWDKYKDDLFKFKTREGHEFAMKPMNCPHHTQIYSRRQWSYRDLPQRYANSTMCYRDEQSGELSGLSRVRAFTQDDAHVFCRASQVKKEALVIWDIIHKFYGVFGLKLSLRLSLHDPAHPDKYLGNKELWKKAEEALREVAKAKKTKFIEAPGEAAFYGPKLDFMAVDSIGRSWQVATIQLDLVQPERFDLACINESGEKERIVMIHAAIMGSIDRFMSVLIEHLAGAFPTWLAPVQVAILPVGKDHWKAALKLKEMIEKYGIRVEADNTNDTVGYKIRRAEKQKVPYMLVLGDKEKSLRSLSVRLRGSANIKKMSVSAFIKKLCKEIETKK